MFADNPGLRPWHPLWAQGEVAIERGDGPAAITALEAALAEPSAADADRGALAIRLAVAHAAAGDVAGAETLVAQRLAELAAEVAGKPVDAMRALRVLPSARRAAPAATAAFMASVTAPDADPAASLAARLWAFSSGDAAPLAEWARDPVSPYWTAEEAVFAEVSPDLRYVVALYLPGRAGLGGDPLRRGIAYAACVHDAAKALGGLDGVPADDPGGALVLRRAADDLIAIAGDFEAEAREHDATFTGRPMTALFARARTEALGRGQYRAYDQLAF
jgi:hypothetical protein